MEGITPLHLLVVLVVAVLILGPGKLPETGAALGKAVRAFRQGIAEESPPARDADQENHRPD